MSFLEWLQLIIFNILPASVKGRIVSDRILARVAGDTTSDSTFDFNGLSTFEKEVLRAPGVKNAVGEYLNGAGARHLDTIYDKNTNWFTRNLGKIMYSGAERRKKVADELLAKVFPADQMRDYGGRTSRRAVPAKPAQGPQPVTPTAPQVTPSVVPQAGGGTTAPRMPTTPVTSVQAPQAPQIGPLIPKEPEPAPSWMQNNGGTFNPVEAFKPKTLKDLYGNGPVWQNSVK